MLPVVQPQRAPCVSGGIQGEVTRTQRREQSQRLPEPSRTRCVTRSLICSAVIALNSRRLPHRASLSAERAQGLAPEDETLLISVSARFLPTAQFCSGGHSLDGGNQRALPCSETTKIPETPHPPWSQLVRP